MNSCCSWAVFRMPDIQHEYHEGLKVKTCLPTTLCLKTSNQNKSKNSKSISDLWFYKWRGSCVLLHPEHPATVVVVGSLTKIHWLRPVLRRASHTLQVLEVYQSLKVNVNAVLFQWWFVCTSWFRLLYNAIVSNRLTAGRQGRTAGWKRLRTVDTWRQDKSCYITFWNARSCHFHCQDKSCYIYISLSDMLEVVTFTVKINHVISLSEMLEVVTITTSIDLKKWKTRQALTMKPKSNEASSVHLT